MIGESYARFIDCGAFGSVRADIAAGKAAHAYIFYGSEEGTLDILARLTAASVFCKRDNPPCLSCADCSKALSATAADIIRLPEGERVLSADIDFLVQSAYIMPHEYEYKIFMIGSAHTMTPEAQNKLLKTLEEPDKTTLLLLKAATLATLLPTVISRCRLVRAPELPAEEIAELLDKKRSADERLAAAVLSMGSLPAAEELLARPKALTVLDLAFETLLNMRRSGDILSYSVRAAKVEDYPLFLQCLSMIFRDIVCVHAGRSKLCLLLNRNSDIIELSGFYSMCACLEIETRINRAKQRIARSGASGQVTDELFFSLLEVRSQCL